MNCDRSSPALHRVQSPAPALCRKPKSWAPSCAHAGLRELEVPEHQNTLFHRKPETWIQVYF